jgi:predicted site-specific integrase-resolvase
MSKLVPIGVAAGTLGVSTSALRRREASGRLVPVLPRVGSGATTWPYCGPGSSTAPLSRRTIAYARVSSHDQKGNLERQKQVLELYCAGQGWSFEVSPTWA